MPQNPPLAIAKYEPLEVASYEPAKDETAQTAETPKSEESSLTIGNLLRGAEKSAVGTFTGLGELVHQIPGVTTAVDALYGTPGVSQQAFKEANQATQARNTGEAVGKTAADIAQYFIPVTAEAGAGKLLTKVPEIVKSGVLGAAQSEGSPLAGGVSAGLTAVLPGGSATGKMASRLEQSAQKSMTRALGPTKEWAKAEAKKLAPQMLARGIGGSRQSMLELATEQTAQLGPRIGQVYKDAAAAGATVSGPIIQGELQFARDALMVPDAAGKLIPMEGAQPILKKLDRLERFVERLGPDVPVDVGQHITTFWQKVVRKAGLYGPKAGAAATDSPEAWALREGAGQFRRLLDTATPDIQALNKEFSFWKGLRDVLKETDARTMAQTGGLYAAIGGAAGAAQGYASGDTLMGGLGKAFVGATLGRNIVKLMQSPAWQTKVSAPLKHKLAEALASGSAGSVVSTSSRIIAALPPQVRAQFAQ